MHWSELGHQGRVGKEDAKERERKRGNKRRGGGGFSQRQSRHRAAVCLEAGLRISGDFSLFPVHMHVCVCIMHILRARV